MLERGEEDNFIFQEESSWTSWNKQKKQHKTLTFGTSLVEGRISPQT